MDLSQLNTKEACEQTFDLVIKHPGTKKPLDIIISIIGIDSEELSKHERSVVDKEIKMLREGAEPDCNYQEKKMIDLCIRATKGWKNIIFKGEELACNEENKQWLYSNESYQWLMLQVWRGVKDLANFMPG